MVSGEQCSVTILENIHVVLAVRELVAGSVSGGFIKDV